MTVATGGQCIVMRDQHKSGALVSRQLHHQLKHLVRRAAVQVAGGFIGEHASRLRDQGACNRYPLAFAARQL